ncbi:MAG: hypothetical protein JWQ71_3734 [Pedosphaera sp.]|nr:hypothetical protein [Pedosphaera sp.]
MPVSHFNCPQCGKRSEIPKEMIGQAVTCPHCNAKFMEKNKQADSGFWLACSGLAVWAFVHFLVSQTEVDYTTRRASEYVGVALLVIGLAMWLWASRDSLIERGGPVLLIAGLCAMAGCLLLDFSQVLIVGGFVAIVGAVLVRR